jgi:hypothetical protein
MEYGHGVDNLISFIRWWISYDCWKEGKNGMPGRVYITTITTHHSGLDLRIGKDSIFNDEPRALKDGEMLIPGDLERLMGEVGGWLKEKAVLSPEKVDIGRCLDAREQFGMAGMGFFVQSIGITDSGLLIHADVIGISK